MPAIPVGFNNWARAQTKLLETPQQMYAVFFSPEESMVTDLVTRYLLYTRGFEGCWIQDLNWHWYQGTRGTHMAPVRVGLAEIIYGSLVWVIGHGMGVLAAEELLFLFLDLWHKSYHCRKHSVEAPKAHPSLPHVPLRLQGKILRMVDRSGLPFTVTLLDEFLLPVSRASDHMGGRGVVPREGTQ
jgi:hypothetical protein